MSSINVIENVFVFLEVIEKMSTEFTLKLTNEDDPLTAAGIPPVRVSFIFSYYKWIVAEMQRLNYDYYNIAVKFHFLFFE